MSEVLVTPSVLGVAAVPLALVAGSAMMAAGLVRRWLESLESTHRRAIEGVLRELPPLSGATLPAPSIAERQARMRLQPLQARLEALALPPADAVRISGLLTLAAGPFLVQNPGLVEQRLSALMNAKTLPEATGARRALRRALLEGHRQAFTHAVAQACSNAARQLGFRPAQLNTGRRGELRLIAANQQGQALVAEIGAQRSGDPSLAAEIVGVRDGSCRQMMDAFEKALAAQGLRYAPPRRKPTGGIVQLEAAREILEGRRSPGAPGPVRSQRAARRRQPLCQPQEVKNR